MLPNSPTSPLRLPICLWLLVSACEEPAESGNGRRHGDDTGSDTGTDTGGDTDTGPPTEHPCVDYFGFHPAEALFTYDFQTDFGLSGTITRQLEAVVDTQVTVRVIELSTWGGPSGDTEFSNVALTYQCDADGVALFSVEGTGESVYGGEPFPWTYSARYDPPALLIPADLAVGSEWTTRYKGSATTDGETERFDETCDWIAVKEQTLSVPAGEFTVLFIDGEGNGEDLSGDIWLERSIGLAKSQVESLASY